MENNPPEGHEDLADIPPWSSNELCWHFFVIHGSWYHYPCYLYTKLPLPFSVWKSLPQQNWSYSWHHVSFSNQFTKQKVFIYLGTWFVNLLFHPLTQGMFLPSLLFKMRSNNNRGSIYKCSIVLMFVVVVITFHPFCP